MDFRIKAFAQKIFSNLPKGYLVNYFFQKHVTKSLPTSDRIFVQKVNEAYQHYQNFLNFNKLEVNTHNYYEFGAGWTLSIPLSISLLGFEVTCIDIRKLMIPKLIIDSIQKFNKNADKLPFHVEKLDENIDEKNILQHLKRLFNINYIAPKDASNTGFQENSFDFISSTETFEHIPAKDILPILKESFRILKKGGILSMFTDYRDHWSYHDKSINYYNFLKFSPQQWQRYNCSLHYQNRLRHSDYMKMVEESGFKVAKENPFLPTDNDVKNLQQTMLHSDYKEYSFDDLAIKGSELVLIKN